MARRKGHARRSIVGAFGISRARASKRHYPASLGGGHFWTGAVVSRYSAPHLRGGTLLDRPGTTGTKKRRRKFLGIF